MDKWPLNTRRKIIFEASPPSLRSSHLKVLMSGHIGWTPPGEYLAMIWVGMCRPGFQIWTPFFKKLHSKWYPVLQIGQFLVPLHDGLPVPRSINLVFSNALCHMITARKVLYDNVPRATQGATVWFVWLLIIWWAFHTFKISYPVLGNVSKMDTPFWIRSPKTTTPLGGTCPYRYCGGVFPPEVGGGGVETK